MEALALVPSPLFHEYETPPEAVTLMDVKEHVSNVAPVLFVMEALTGGN
jgi:hypothetical protein